MHYSKDSMGVPAGLMTIKPRDESFLDSMGNSKDATHHDWDKVCTVYNCRGKSFEGYDPDKKDT